MPRLTTISTNFTAGEQSPRLRGRVDLEKYAASATELFNVVVLKQGGATIRPPTRFIREVKDSSQTARIIPFIYSRTDTYLLEFGDAYMRVFKDDAVVESSPGTPYEVTTPYSDDQLAALDWSQGADTMLAAHPDVYPQSIQRFADSRWVVRNAPFDPAPTAEMGERDPSITMTTAANTVGAGAIIGASSAFFLAADLGRVLTWEGGRATITAVVNSTVVNGTVTEAFAAATSTNWLLEGSPQSACTPSAASPVGASCTLTLAAAGWRSDVVGGIIEINGGMVHVTGYTSTTVISGVIVDELSGTSAAPADSWTQRKIAFNAVDGYPATISFFQQRTWLANTYRFPQTKMGSRSGLFFDFQPGVADDSAIFKTVDSDEINPIQYLLSDDNLISLTLGGEFELLGGVEKPVTMTNAAIKRRTRWGCAQVRPEQAGDDIVFIQRGGKVMRAIRRAEFDGFSAPDVSVFSEHLLRQGITSMSFEQTPESVMWCATGDGKLVAVTYNPEQQTIAFCSGDVGGFVEWVATVPAGEQDATYLLVRRTIDGATKRYIEKIDWGDWINTQEIRNAHDCRMESTGAASAVWSGFDHLEGETVSVLADGIYMGDDFVVTGGEIELPREATTVSVGIPYRARIKQQAPEVGTGSGTSQGQAISNHRVSVRVLNTIGLWVNDEEVTFRSFDVDETLDSAPEVFSGIKEVTTGGWEQGESELTLEQQQPYPWTVLNIIRSFTVNAG